MDSKGDIALDIALNLRYESLALCLVQHGANVDCVDLAGQRLLHKAILRSMFIYMNNYSTKNIIGLLTYFSVNHQRMIFPATSF